MSPVGLRLLAVLVAVLLLTGAKCAVVFSSGGDGGSGDDGDEEVPQGLFLAFRSDGLAVAFRGSVTFSDSEGLFSYGESSRVTVAVGDVELGSVASGTSPVTVPDLVPGAEADDREVINRARFLLSIDRYPEQSTIRLPRALHDRARVTDPDAGPWVEALDFDDDSFDSVAANLVAILTADYPFTASLVSPAYARDRLGNELADLP
jgi:hypothetical protein